METSSPRTAFFFGSTLLLSICSIIFFFVEQYGRDALDAAAVMAPSASDTAAVARAAMTAATLAVVVLLRDVAAAVCRLDVAAAASTGTAAAAI